MTPQSPAVTAPLSGEPNETSPERGGEPSLDGGGVLVESLASCNRFTELPLSQACGLPAQHKARPSGALSGAVSYTHLTLPTN